MNRLGILLFFIAMSLFLSCGEDSAEVGNFINYDDDNASSPILPAGDHETAVYFPASVLNDFEGRRIKNIRVFIYNLPASLNLVISEGSSSTEPGVAMYDRPFIGLIRANAWNIHTMTQDIIIDGNPFWVRVQFSHDNTLQTIGCDAGPGESGGDWLYQSDDQEWLTFQARTGESINWNIRIELDE